MMIFSYILAIFAGHLFGVNAFTQIAIGEDSVIPPLEIASTPVFSTDPPSPRWGYKISNIGNAGVRASIYWKDWSPLQTSDIFCEAPLNCSSSSGVNVWYELADPVNIEPTESAVIKPSSRAIFYFTRLVVVPNYLEKSSDLEAIVNVAYEKGGIKAVSRQEKSVSENLTKIFKLGGSKLPQDVAVSGMEAFVELFWPDNKTSVWDEVLDSARTLIDPETFFAIKTLVTGPLMDAKPKLVQIARTINDHRLNESEYMDLAQYLLRFKEKFTIHGYLSDEKSNEFLIQEKFIMRNDYDAKKLNEALLPLYSNIILMEAAFFSLGIKCQLRFGLSKHKVAYLKSYFTNLVRNPVHGADQHISVIFKNQCLKHFEYSRVMHMRNKINEHGYVPIWNNMLDHPGQELVETEIFYSDFKGSFIYGEEVFPPSKDPLTSVGVSNEGYNELRTLIVYQSPDGCAFNCCADTIVGMKLVFKNGATSEFGEITHVFRTIVLNGVYRIREIETRGNDTFDAETANIRISLLKMDKNEWKTSTQDEYIFGCPSSTDSAKKYSFAKENHYIASIYPSFDGPPRRYPGFYPLFRMGVAFLPLKSQFDDAVRDENWKEWSC